MNVKVPCKECQKRCLGCHSNCDEYKEYRNNMDDIRERRFRHNQLENDLYKTRGGR